MKNEIIFKGQPAKIEKVANHHYCKAGAYEHKYKAGWVVTINSEIVLGGRNTSNGHGAMRHERPEYITRKSLLLAVDYFNEQFDRRQKTTTPTVLF